MNKYWVGGTGDWSDSTNHWALTSGGVPAPLLIPTSSDDVFIDANSGFGSGGTITIDGNIVHKDFIDSSGHSFTITDNENFYDWFIYGNFTLGSTVSFEGTPNLTFYNSSSINLDTNSVTIPLINFLGTGEVTLTNELYVLYKTTIKGGTFTSGTNNVTSGVFDILANVSNTIVNMGSGTWKILSDNGGGEGWLIYESGGGVVTINPGTSSILVDEAIATGTFYGGDKTYNNLTIDGTNEYSIFSANTFNELRINPGSNVFFSANLTQTVSSFIANGVFGNEITLNSDDSINQFTLSKPSGTVVCDYLNISNSSAAGGANWYAGNNSVDTVNNDGWIFEDEPFVSTYTIAITVGSFIQQLNSIYFKRGLRYAITVGSFIQQLNSIYFKRGLVFLIEKINYTAIFISVLILKSLKLIINTVSYALSIKAALFKKGLKIFCTKIAYETTFIDILFAKTNKLILSSISYAISINNTLLKRGLKYAIATIDYTISAKTALFSYGRKIIINSLNYTQEYVIIRLIATHKINISKLMFSISPKKISVSFGKGIWRYVEKTSRYGYETWNDLTMMWSEWTTSWDGFSRRQKPTTLYNNQNKPVTNYTKINKPND